MISIRGLEKMELHELQHLRQTLKHLTFFERYSTGLILKAKPNPWLQGFELVNAELERRTQGDANG